MKEIIKDIINKINNIRRHNTPEFFSVVEIETTTYCNRKCTYCPNSISDRGDIKNIRLMEESLFRKIIDELAEIRFNGRLSPHFYGEPLTDKRLPILLSYARNKLPEAKIVIYTNGDLLNEDTYNELKKAGVDLFHVSNPVGLNINKKDIKVYNLTKEELYNRGALLDIPKKKASCCLLPYNNLVINYRGDIVLCCNDFYSTKTFGNLKEESLIDIWNKKEYKLIRNELKEGILILDICKGCINNK